MADSGINFVPSCFCFLALYGRDQVINVLLSGNAFCNIDEQDSCGSTPFMDALRGGHIDIAKRLFVCGVSQLWHFFVPMMILSIAKSSGSQITEYTLFDFKFMTVTFVFRLLSIANYRTYPLWFLYSWPLILCSGWPIQMRRCWPPTDSSRCTSRLRSLNNVFDRDQSQT